MPYSAVSLTLPTLHIYAIDYDIAIARQEELQTFQKGLDARNEQRKSAGLPSLSEVVTTIHRNTFLLHHNQALIDHIQANVAAHPGDIHKLVSFSNRGSYEIDQVNRGAHSIDSGSSFDFMPQLAEACGVDFEPIFMADVFADLPFGSTFQRATMPDFKGEHLRCPMDSKKISTTYLHTQHFANLYPGSTVHYYPYDDSAIRDPNNDEVSQILEANCEYFTKYSSLLPDTAQITYHHYTGNQYPPKALYQCKGSGSTDKSYVETIKRMACISSGLRFDHNWQFPSPVRKVHTHTLDPKDFRSHPNKVTPLSVFRMLGASSSSPSLTNSRRSSSSSGMIEEVEFTWQRPSEPGKT